MIQPRLHHSLPVEAEQLVSLALHFRFFCIRRERHDLRSGLSVPADEERVADTAQFMRLRHQLLSHSIQVSSILAITYTRDTAENVQRMMHT